MKGNPGLPSQLGLGLASVTLEVVLCGKTRATHCRSYWWSVVWAMQTRVHIEYEQGCSQEGRRGGEGEGERGGGIKL